MPHVLTLDDYEEVNNECEYSNWVEQASPSYVNGVPTYLDAQGELIEGIYLDMPNDVYHALPALSSSKLKKFIDSPAHYYREYLSSITRKRTTAMQNTFDAGTHAHTLVLEPEGYYERYFRDVMPIDYPDALHTAVQIEAALVKLGLKKSGTKAEKIAPKINATTIKICVVGTTKETTANAILTITTKIANNLYSALKKAKAPSYMWSEISFILPSPASCFITHFCLTHM